MPVESNTDEIPPIDASKMPEINDLDRWTFIRILKLIFLACYFVTGAISICLSQFLIIITTFYNKKLQRLLLNYTKTNFIILFASVIQWVTPSKLVITHDETIPQNTFQYRSTFFGTKILESHLNNNAIVIANHQIYTDWVYLWFMAYLNYMGNNIYIIMKESLKKIPILGYGMKNYNFIFLSRRWENDRSLMTRQLAKIDYYCRVLKDKTRYLNLQKFWIILFPEGTNMSDDRLEKSNAWCDKIGKPRMKHVLFPRVKGLYFTTLKLSQSSTTIYNATIGYSGVKATEFAQDVYTMKRMFILGHGPKEIHIHFSKSDITEIDNFDYKGSLLTGEVNEEEEVTNMAYFETWLVKKWNLKDLMMAQFYETGNFGEDLPRYEIDLRVKSYFDILRIFVIPISFSVVLYYLLLIIFK